MDFGLSDEQEMIVSTVRSFVENEIYPHEAEVERTGEVPPELGAAIKQKVIDLGFYACNFPESVGGDGMNHVDFTLVERELGRARDGGGDGGGARVVQRDAARGDRGDDRVRDRHAVRVIRRAAATRRVRVELKTISGSSAKVV